MKQQYNNEFKTIDTEAKAYFLGFFHADGNLHLSKSGGYHTKIKLAIKDKEILNRFVSEFPFFKTHSTSDNYEWKGEIRTNYKYKLDAYSKELFYDLFNMDIKNSIPKLSEELIPHFLRGLIDGDGSWGVQSEQFSKTTGKKVKYYGMTLCIDNEEVFNSISKILLEQGITSTKRKVDPILILRVRKKEELIKLINYLYKDANWYLKRKSKTIKEIIDYLGPDKFRELLENPEEDNQQPSLDSDILEGSTTSSESQEDNNSTTSAGQFLYDKKKLEELEKLTTGEFYSYIFNKD